MDESSSKDAERARRFMAQRFKDGETQQASLIERVSKMVIRDRLVLPTKMRFLSTQDTPELVIRYGEEGEAYRIHHHALGQLAGKVELPMTLVNKLSGEVWRTELLAHNLNELYGHIPFKERNGEPSKFLHRIVGSELRGFLSRRFGRHLASLPLLRAFVESCQEVGALPVEAVTTDVRLALKCYLPCVFEPVPGECLAVGVEWSNSDFGAGKLNVRLTAWRVSAGSRFTTLDETVSRVHLGSVIQESDIEMSAETAAKEIDAVASAIRDAVIKQLEPEPVERLLAAVQAASEAEVPWHRLKSQLSKFLYRKEVENIEQMLNDEGIVDLPPVGKDSQGNPLPTKWWASSVVAWVAERVSDTDRRLELQAEAGRMLGEG